MLFFFFFTGIQLSLKYIRIYTFGAAVFYITKGFHGWKTWGIFTYHWVTIIFLLLSLYIHWLPYIKITSLTRTYLFSFSNSHTIENISLVLSLSFSVLWCCYYSNLPLGNLMHHIWQYHVCVCVCVYIYIYIYMSSSDVYQHIKYHSVFDRWK